MLLILSANLCTVQIYGELSLLIISESLAKMLFINFHHYMKMV